MASRSSQWHLWINFRPPTHRSYITSWISLPARTYLCFICFVQFCIKFVIPESIQIIIWLKRMSSTLSNLIERSEKKILYKCETFWSALFKFRSTRYFIFKFMFSLYLQWSVYYLICLFVMQVFEGNSDSYSVKHSYLDEPILARYIKFHTVQWNRHPSMRVEIVGCQGSIIDIDIE